MLSTGGPNVRVLAFAIHMSALCVKVHAESRRRNFRFACIPPGKFKFALQTKDDAAPAAGLSGASEKDSKEKDKKEKKEKKNKGNGDEEKDTKKAKKKEKKEKSKKET